MSRRLLLIAMLPAALVTAARAAFLVLALWDIHPFWLWTPLSLSEAAALRDRGEVSRLLAEGQDPNATYRVRKGFLRDYPMWLTPIDAAQAARRDEIVQILIDAGARVNEPKAAGASRTPVTH
jgi:hypothetical protein